MARFADIVFFVCVVVACGAATPDSVDPANCRDLDSDTVCPRASVALQVQSVQPALGKKKDEDESRLANQEEWDRQTESHDIGRVKGTTDTSADDATPQPDLNPCTSLPELLKSNGCKRGDPCDAEIQAKFDLADINNDGKLCRDEIPGQAPPDELDEPLPPISNDSQSMLQVTLQQRLLRIKQLFEAGELDNATHMGMLMEVFSDPEHLHASGMSVVEDRSAVSSPAGSEGSLAEGEAAADGTVVNRTVYYGPAPGLQTRGMALFGGAPIRADSDGDHRLSMDEFGRALLSAAGPGVSLLDAGTTLAEFNQGDLNRDGFLDMHEVKVAFYEKSGREGQASTVSFKTPATYFGAGECQTSQPHWVGDGYCDRSLNTEACMWDGGDCCQDTCSRAVYTCGSGGYSCQPPAVSHYRSRNPYFDQAGIDQHAFRVLHAWSKQGYARGCSSWNGESLSQGEWHNLLRAYNRGTVITTKTNCGGSDCGNNMCGWMELMYPGGGKFGHSAGHADMNMEFGTGLCTRTGSYNVGDNFIQCTFIHEMAHTAGYTHPGYDGGQEEWGTCHAIGWWYDHCNGDRCRTTGDSCTTHGHKDSKCCWWLCTGCKAKCVKASYSMTMPERACWCKRVRRGVRCAKQ